MDWWVNHYSYTCRLNVAIRFLNSRKGRTLWFDLISNDMIITANQLVLQRRADVSAEMRETALLSDWLVAQQMSELRMGYQTRADLARFRID